MSTIKCREEGVIKSSLMFLQASTGLVLKVWYEDAWDVSETNHLIVEEISSYRINPQSYVQSQIGIR